MERHFLGVTYLTEVNPIAAIDEERQIQEELAEVLRKRGLKFVVVPGDLLTADVQKALEARGDAAL